MRHVLMIRFASLRKVCLLAVLLGSPVLAACGGGSGDSAPPSTDQFLASRLAAAGVTAPPQPAEDPAPLVELGRALFFDKILSGNQNISCATCHHPSAATGDALPVSIGEGGSGLAENRQQGGGALIPRNAPHIFNLGVEGHDVMFWDGRVRIDPATGELTTPEPGLNGPTPTLAAHAALLDSALAAQAMFPVTSHEEMRGMAGSNEIADAANNVEVWARLMARLVGTSNGTVGGIAEYRQMFDAAFPGVASYDDYNFGHAAAAIAAFERTFWTALDTPFDQYLRGDASALSNAEKRGALLFFGEANCSSCHSGPHLSDFDFHAIAVPQVGPGKVEHPDDRGLALQTGNSADDYKFRTPPLRNVALTRPYMHSGCYTTLENAVKHHFDCVANLNAYDPNQLPPLFRPTFDGDPTRQAARAQALSTVAQPFTLTDSQIEDLLAFMHALTDPNSLDLSGDTPDQVPSGLPIND